MKLALSNICLNSKEDYNRLVEEQGLAVESAYGKLDSRSVAVQSLFYDVPSDFTFEHPRFEGVLLERLLHISNNTHSAEEIPVVFGAPSIRNTKRESYLGGVLRKAAYAESMLPTNTRLCVENVPSRYGSTVYTTPTQIINAGHSLHLDIGNAFLEKEVISDRIVTHAYHVHVSAPDLFPISTCEDPEYFAYLKEALKLLAESRYEGYISIEMKPCTYWEAKESVLLVKEMLNEIQSK